MKHEERIKIAQGIVEKLLTKYKKDIQTITLYGSTARGEDKKYSDIELIVYTKGASQLRSKEYPFKHITIAIYIKNTKDVEKRINDVDILWPLEVASYTNNKVLYGDKQILKRFLKKMNSVSTEKVHKAVEDYLPHYIDLVNKIKNTNNKNDLLEYSREVLYGINLSVALINKKYFTRNYYRNFIEAYKFPKLPKNYKEKIEELFPCKNVKKIKSLVNKFTKSYFEFLEKEGIKLKVYKDLSFI